MSISWSITYSHWALTTQPWYSGLYTHTHTLMHRAISQTDWPGLTTLTLRDPWQERGESNSKLYRSRLETPLRPHTYTTSHACTHTHTHTHTCTNTTAVLDQWVLPCEGQSDTKAHKCRRTHTIERDERAARYQRARCGAEGAVRIIWPKQSHLTPCNLPLLRGANVNTAQAGAHTHAHTHTDMHNTHKHQHTDMQQHVEVSLSNWYSSSSGKQRLIWKEENSSRHSRALKVWLLSLGRLWWAAKQIYHSSN